MGPKQLRHTLSAWLWFGGVSAGLLGRRRLGGTLLLLQWFGHAGLTWDRYAAADLRNLRSGHREAVDASQLLLHGLLGLLGLRWLLGARTSATAR